MKRNQLNIFLNSALTEENPFISTDDVHEWLKKRNKEVIVEVEQIKFSELDNWGFDKNKTRLSHLSGKISCGGIKMRW